MADLDFITDLTSGFAISLTNNPQKVSGNRALLNRFEITFLTHSKSYLLGDNPGSTYIDNYGGNADVLVTTPQILNDPGAITATLSVCIERTVQSMQRDEPENTPENEKIDSAQLLNIYIQNDIIMATIQVFPVETDSYASLVTNLPVIKR